MQYLEINKKDEGISIKNRQRISKLLYDQKNGTNADVKESNQIEIEKIIGNNPKLIYYIDDKITKLYETELYKNRWTNNNCESLNNVFKQEIDWRPQKTEDLIAILKNVVKRKLLDIKSAIFSAGNYSLAQEYCRYKINSSKWNAMGSEWQRKEFLKFLKDSLRVGKGESEVKKKYKGLNVAKKPCQSKRPINERTR